MIKHPFVKQRSEAPPVTVVVTAAWRRWTGRAGRVSGTRVLSVTTVLFIIPVGQFGAHTQWQVMRYWTAPYCWMPDFVDVLNVTSSPRTGVYTGRPFFHLKKAFQTQTSVYWFGPVKTQTGCQKLKDRALPVYYPFAIWKYWCRNCGPQKCSASKSSQLMALNHFCWPNLWQNDEFGQRAELMAAIRGDFAS